ncbi:NIPSNAP family protein [Kibdelosporangium persicum]|uniref:NIPSNAP domain-containing protein n=1 Tax=Kibdelosporangium persicum TaxID=2698649 RepID=A0ABX2FC85_9PSEU|nr:NIPSNAP family protein [Kibdelosporangium persicum]NRN68492.1 NIPSNAP domain-containing protein [Kibdelosporangium persicum]
MIVELRQYTLKPGRRDTLVEIFEKHFVDTQEAVGITLIGLFHDLDNPDRFVWLRGFQDMRSRKAALIAFYEQGEAWKTHGPAANATMIDSDDVLLLRPLGDVVVDREYGQYTAVISARPAEVAEPVMRFEPLVAENTYPRLPVREEQMFVTVYAGGDSSGSEGLRLKPTAGSAMR